MKNYTGVITKVSIIGILLIFAGYQYGQSFELPPNSEIKRSKVVNGFGDPDSLGTVISTIEFKLKATKGDLDTVEDDIIPWINIDKPNEKIDSLIDADKIVLPFSEAILIIDYPLKKEVRFIISGGKKGFSRRQLIKIISEKYHYIYDTEEQTATEKTIPQSSREASVNRNETDGIYGIWGHDISDLDLSSIEVHKDANRNIYLVLDIDS